MESLDTLDTKESERDQRKADPKRRDRKKGVDKKLHLTLTKEGQKIPTTTNH